MRKIKAKSLPMKDVITDLAKEFGTDYIEDCDEYSLSIPEEWGEGAITGINFPSGLGILIYNCRFKEDLEISFTVNQVHPVKFLFVTEGSIGHLFANESGKHKIGKYRGAIVASSGQNGHVLCFAKSEKVEISSLEIHRERFMENLNCGLEEMEPSLQSLLQDIKANHTFYHEGDYSLFLADALSEIKKFEPKGIIRKLFLEGKAYQMLTHEVIQYEDDLKEEGGQEVIRRKELDKLLQAMNLIKQNLSDINTVKDLARRVGTNENKLQEGFKHLTRCTVNQFIQNARLDAAKELLISSDLSISEIVYSIGLSNRGYFSKIFKEKYQVSPSSFRNRAKS